MILLGVRQELQIQKESTFGVYLSSVHGETSTADPLQVLDTDSVLLPKAQVPLDAKKGDLLCVFIYKDSEDRPIATTLPPALELHQITRLTVKAAASIGAFLDWGLAKDLLLPYREQTHSLKEGDSVLAALYIDKSQRLCATMHIYPYLSTDSPYQKGEWVDGMVYEILPNFGAYVVIDDRYSAMIPSREITKALHAGDNVHARIAIRHEDGKLGLSLNDTIPNQLDTDANTVLTKLKEAGGFLPYHDKSDPKLITEQFRLSKNAFKRAIGHLMKDGQISIAEDGIRLKRS